MTSNIADPAPLGLAAFALTTFVLSAINAGLVSKAIEPIVFGLALAYGGLAQLLAGMWEFRKGNTFGATAFTSFGAFWLSFWAFETFFASKVPEAQSGKAAGLFLFAWGVFTLYMWIASFRTTAPINAVFLALMITFFLLAIGDWQDSTALKHAGGYAGLLTAVLAWYASFAGVANSTFGKDIVPNPSLKH